VLRSINMRLEGDTFFFDLSRASQGKYLVPTAIRKDRPVPAVKAMQAPGLLQHFQPGTQVQVVCVTQNDLCLYILFELLLGHSFYGATRPHRHEDRRLYLPMIGDDNTRTGFGTGICMLQLKRKGGHSAAR